MVDDEYLTEEQKASPLGGMHGSCVAVRITSASRLAPSRIGGFCMSQVSFSRYSGQRGNCNMYRGPRPYERTASASGSFECFVRSSAASRSGGDQPTESGNEAHAVVAASFRALPVSLRL